MTRGRLPSSQLVTGTALVPLSSTAGAAFDAAAHAAPLAPPRLTAAAHQQAIEWLLLRPEGTPDRAPRSHGLPPPLSPLPAASRRWMQAMSVDSPRGQKKAPWRLRDASLKRVLGQQDWGSIAGSLIVVIGLLIARACLDGPRSRPFQVTDATIAYPQL